MSSSGWRCFPRPVRRRMFMDTCTADRPCRRNDHVREIVVAEAFAGQDRMRPACAAGNHGCFPRHGFHVEIFSAILKSTSPASVSTSFLPT